MRDLYRRLIQAQIDCAETKGTKHHAEALEVFEEAKADYEAAIADEAADDDDDDED